jgi:hypothetical protein
VALTLVLSQLTRDKKLLLAAIASQGFFISFYVFLVFEPVDLLSEVRAGVVIIKVPEVSSELLYFFLINLAYELGIYDSMAFLCFHLVHLFHFRTHLSRSLFQV